MVSPVLRVEALQAFDRRALRLESVLVDDAEDEGTPDSLFGIAQRPEQARNLKQEVDLSQVVGKGADLDCVDPLRNCGKGV
jgi:hypothetical protein